MGMLGAPPVKIPTKVWREPDKLIPSFIWEKETNRIGLETKFHCRQDEESRHGRPQTVPGVNSRLLKSQMGTSAALKPAGGQEASVSSSSSLPLVPHPLGRAAEKVRWQGTLGWCQSGCRVLNGGVSKPSPADLICNVTLFAKRVFAKVTKGLKMKSHWVTQKWKSESVSHSVVSNSLRPHEL